MDPDDNAVSPSPESCRSVFELGFKTWSCCSRRVSRGAKQEALGVLGTIDHAFPNHPALASSLKLTKSADCWVASGISSWDAGTGSSSTDPSTSICAATLPGIAPQKHSFPVTKSKPTKLTLVESLESGLSSLFGDKDDHITILILAWAYIVSARWAELIPGAKVKYNEVRAEPNKHEHSSITVPIGTMSGEAARWWQSVLDPGHGWLATAETDGKTLYSPWSISLPSRTTLLPLFLGHPPKLAPIPDSATALQFLSEYVTMNNIVGQSRVALSAVLCLPFANRSGGRISLPVPSIPTRLTTPQQSISSPPFPLAQVDKLLTLSCNDRGVEAILLSCFYNPTIPCNLVSPFLQGTFAALDGVSQDPLLLILTLLRRSPRVGFLWVGAAVIGAHLPLLEKARYGGFKIELHSAVWTGTIQTFMQLPVSATLPGRIRREDECRLAYLVSECYQQNLPFLPWKPFGTVDLKDAELDVQLHGGCHGHELRYRGWAWDCWEDVQSDSVTNRPPVFHGTEDEPAPAPQASVEVPYEVLDFENDSASCTATLNIFMWLRRAGFAGSEQHIRRHEWLCETFDDEEEEAYESWPEDEEDSVGALKKRPKSAAPRRRLGGWLASTQARREESV